LPYRKLRDGFTRGDEPDRAQTLDRRCG